MHGPEPAQSASESGHELPKGEGTRGHDADPFWPDIDYVSPPTSRPDRPPDLLMFESPRRPPRTARVVLLLAAVAALGVGGYLLGRTVMDGSDDPGRGFVSVPTTLPLIGRDLDVGTEATIEEPQPRSLNGAESATVAGETEALAPGRDGDAR